LAIAVATFLPTSLWVAARRSAGSTATVQDSLLQIEAGLDFIRRGESPYGQDYSNTPMGHLRFEVHGLTENPALHHVIYLPFFFEFSYPFYTAALKLWGWWDQRLLYMALLAVCLGCLFQLTRSAASRLGLLPLLGLNPMLMLAFLQGGNDVFPLTFVALSAWLLYRRQLTLSMIMLALAVASKHTAWFVVPFFLIHMLGPWPWKRRAAVRVARQAWPAVVVLAVSLGPFLLTDPRGLIMDTLGYILGLSPNPVYIAGVGFGELLFRLGVVQVTGNYPFWLWQIGIGLPLLIWLAAYQIRHRDPRRIWIDGACFGIIVSFFGRVFFDSYLGFYLVVAALGALADPVSVTPESRWRAPPQVEGGQEIRPL